MKIDRHDRIIGERKSGIHRHRLEAKGTINAKLALYLVGVTCLISGFAQFFYNPILPFVQAELQTTLTWVNLTVTVYTVSMACMQVVFGSVADRRGRRRALLIGLTLFVIASFGAAFAKSIYALLIARALQGMGAASVPVVAAAVIGDLFEGKERTKAMGTYQVIMALAPAIGPLIGGIIGGNYGYFGVFLFLALTAVILLLANAVWLKESKPNITADAARLSVKSFKVFLIRRKSRAIMLIGLTQAFSSTILMVFIPTIFSQYFKATPGIIGASFLLMSLCFIISLKAGHKLEHLWGAEKSFVYGCWLNAVSVVLFAFVIWVSLPFGILLFCFYGATYGISMPPPLTMLTELFKEERATAVSIYNLCRNAGMALAPMIGALLYSSQSTWLLFGTVFVVYGIGISLCRYLLHDNNQPLR
ncbi:MFS transporter [Paenibacillus aestuarii]|uniref:MFS transporter n=1 Tax=Paenibacillus aestuarii TaxID=516965 RepID=A0ABW0KBD8_9BACL|nr:MFS transporter [Paenibacillus aestuarii]